MPFSRASSPFCWPAGNSPWPIGVTSIGIHDRTSREKISHVMNGAAHVMNDEATRKYLQVSLTVGLRTCRSCGSSWLKFCDLEDLIHQQVPAGICGCCSPGCATQQLDQLALQTGL